AGYWYAFSCAKKLGQDDGQWRALGKNVPMTFKYFPNEEARFAAATEQLDTMENLREYFGLDMTRLIAVVIKAAKIVQSSTTTTGKVQNADISAWLQQNIKWTDPKRCPSANTVGQLLGIGESLNAAPRAKATTQAIRASFGRDTLFDQHSKVLVLCQRSLCPAELEFVTEFLGMKMLRGAENVSASELKSKAGDVSFALFAKRYGDFLLTQLKAWISDHPRGELIFRSPWAFHKEFPLSEVADLSWMSGVPRPLSLAVAHFRQVLAGNFNQEIKGLLASPPAGGASPIHAKSLNKIKDFWTEFELKLEGSTASESKAVAEDMKVPESTEKITEDDSLGKLKSDRQNSVRDAFPAAGGVAQEICKNSSQSFAAVYDPKCAAIAKTYAHQSKFQRLPVLQEGDFKEFTKAMNDLRP
ncbi:unnamed protein product, partial [Symbiodinium pilosum]